MMLWQYTPLISQIDTLLEKEDVTLQEILDEDDVLQECKAHNKKLVDFLIIPQNLSQLVDYVVRDPPEDAADTAKYKYPNIACELLSADVNDIIDALTEQDCYLDQFDDFLMRKPPLNPLSASFYMRVMAMLIQKKGERMIQFLKSKKVFLKRIVIHLGTSAITELLLRMVQCSEGSAVKKELTEWLTEEQLVSRIVAGLDPAEDAEVNTNAAHCLAELIVTCRDQLFRHGCFLRSETSDDGEDFSDSLALALLDAAESPTVVQEIFSLMFREEASESALLSGMSVLQSLMDKRKNESPLDPPACSPSEAEQERLSRTCRAITDSLLPLLPKLIRLLRQPPAQRFTPMPTTTGVLSPPLGNTRLQIVRLFQTLIQANVESLLDELHTAEFLAIAMELFFTYSLNTFLHRAVTDIVCHLISTPHSQRPSESVHAPLLTQLLKDNTLLTKIIDVWEEDEAESFQNKKVSQRGYIGHLCRIANVFNDSREVSEHKEVVGAVFAELSVEEQTRWLTFSDGSLKDYNGRSAFDLILPRVLRDPTRESILRSSGSLSDDGDDSLNLEFPTNLPLSTLQSAYSEYQAQQMTMTFADERGFKEDDFADTLDKIESIFTERIPIISCEILTPEDAPNATMFEQACNEHMRQFDDPFEEELEEEEEDLEEDEAGGDGKSRRGRPNAELSDRYEEEEEGEEEEEEEEEEEDGWRVRKLKVLPKGPAASPNAAAGGSDDEEDDEDEEEEDEARGSRNGGGDGKGRRPRPESSSEDSSDEDLDSPAVVRSSHPRANFTAFPDLGNLLVTRGSKDSARPQNSNAAEGAARKVWAAPQLRMFTKFPSGSSDEDDEGQADDAGRDRTQVAARMAQYAVPENRLFVRSSPPSTPRGEESAEELRLTDLSTEDLASPREDGSERGTVRVTYEPAPQTVDRLRAEELDETPDTPSNSPSVQPEEGSAEGPADGAPGDSALYRSRCTLRLKTAEAAKEPVLPQTNRPVLGRGRARGPFSISRHTLNGPVKKNEDDSPQNLPKPPAFSSSSSNGPV